MLRTLRPLAALHLTVLLLLYLTGCGGGGGGGSSAGSGAPGPATQLVVSTQPAGAAPAAPFATQPVIQIRDASGLVVNTDNSTQVSVGITSGTGAGGATLGGTLTVTAVNGIATFGNLQISLAGLAYTLTFTSNPALSQAVSVAFNVAVPGTPAQVAMRSQPAGAVAATPFTTQPQVEIRDSAGALVASDNTTQVSAAITSATGSAGAVLSGTLTRTATGGIVSFTNLAIDLAGAGYTLTFSSGVLTPAVSAGFSVGAPGGSTAPFLPTAPVGAATYYVDDAPGASDANNGTSLATAWRTLQRAADLAVPGNIIEVADGNYARFTIQNKGTVPAIPPATLGAPIVFRATGTGAIINSGTSSSVAPDNRDAIKITHCNGIIIHGLRTQNAFRAGVRIDDCYYVTIQAGVFANGGTWGIFTDYSDFVSLIGNECRNSGTEHGIYHSNGGDNAILRGNYCHDNNASGLQINADPRAIDPSYGTRGDGIAQNTLIENNWCLNNGAAGGAGLNFASIRNCDIRNNLVICNKNQSGMAFWDDDVLNDVPSVPGYGSMNNRIYHNTVVMQPGTGRFCITFLNGSTGNTVRDNILRGGARGCLTFSTNSLTGLIETHNCVSVSGTWALYENDTTSQQYTLAQWFASGANRGVSTLNSTPLFTNSAINDWTLTAASPGVDTGMNVGVATTYNGGTRPLGAGYDMGCFER